MLKSICWLSDWALRISKFWVVQKSQCSFYELNSVSTRTGHFLAWRSAFRHARVIMSIAICNFLLQTKHGNVKMFSYFPPGSPSPSQKNLSVFKPLSTDTFMYKWNGFTVDSGSKDRLLEYVCGESLVVPNSLCLSFYDTQGEALRFTSYD